MGRQLKVISSFLLKRVWRKKKKKEEINEDKDEVQEYPNKPLKETLMDKLNYYNEQEERVDGLIVYDLLLKQNY